MSIDVVTLALAKAYADELVANGGDPEKTEQIIRDKINEVLGSIGTGADWAVNDETAAGYIKNRTHYDINKTVKWDGNTSGLDSVTLLEQEAEGIIMSYVMYKVSEEFENPETICQIKEKDVNITMVGDGFQAEITSEDMGIGENYLFEEGKYYMALPFILWVEENNTRVSFEDLLGEGKIYTFNKGLWLIKANMPQEIEDQSIQAVLWPHSINIKGTKRLDLKYIPEAAFGNIEAKDYGDWAQIFITKRDGSVQTITINDGPAGEPGPAGYTPKRGTDYWTSSDIAQIKSYVDSAILGGSW